MTSMVDNALKLSYVWTDVWGEICTTGFHTGDRDPTLDGDLIDVMVADIAAFFGPCAPITVIKATVARWQTGPSFTGWHQRASRDMANGQGSSNLLPPQCAMVGQYNNQSETSFPIGQRRNRMYIGPLRSGSISTDGRLTDAVVDDWAAGLQTMSTDLGDVATVSGLEAFGGLAVCSPTADKMFDAEEIVMDRAVDTQRRRREKVPGDRQFYVL